MQLFSLWLAIRHLSLVIFYQPPLSAFQHFRFSAFPSSIFHQPSSILHPSSRPVELKPWHVEVGPWHVEVKLFHMLFHMLLHQAHLFFPRASVRANERRTFSHS